MWGIMTEQSQAHDQPTQNSKKVLGVSDPVFTSYHRGYKYAVLVRADATTLKTPITRIRRYDVVFEDGTEISKRDFVGSFFGSHDQLVVGECERQEIAKRPADRPIHHALLKLLNAPETIIGAKIRLKLACGWVVEGLLSNVRLYSLGVQVPGDHKQRANILRHAIMGFEVVGEPGADEDSTRVIDYWNQARKKHREKDAQKMTQPQPALEKGGDDKCDIPTSPSDTKDEAVA